VLTLLLAACALGMSNFAASVALGTGGAPAATVVRVAAVFGVCEAGMPVAGLLLGRGVTHALGGAAQPVSGVLLAGAGVYALAQARGDGGGAAGNGTAGDRPAVMAAATSGWRLLLAGLVLSLDNLTVGFALGTYHVRPVPAAVVIGAVSVALSVAGLLAGARLGRAAGRRSGVLAGLVLAGAGAAVIAGVL
jgi:manganese efflux pump family protein